MNHVFVKNELDISKNFEQNVVHKNVDEAEIVFEIFLEMGKLVMDREDREFNYIQ